MAPTTFIDDEDFHYVEPPTELFEVFSTLDTRIRWVAYLRGVREDGSPPHTVWRWDRISTNYEKGEGYASEVINSFFTGDEARQLASYLEGRGDADVCVERVNFPVDLDRFAAEHNDCNTYVPFDDYDRPALGIDIIGFPIEPPSHRH
jgi:hypothetical protein